MEAKCSTSSLRNALCSAHAAHRDSSVYISVWNSQAINRLNSRDEEELKEIINSMGLLSAKAQSLRIPVTDYDRLRSCGSTQRLYICTSVPPQTTSSISPFVVVKGILKVGVKNLFITRHNGYMHKMSPLCVLDFYVHHSCQRKGLGQVMFESMLKEENVQMHQVGYDRPSNKLLSFLAKHYGLKKYMPQVNQFVVFDAYFEDPPINTSNKLKHTHSGRTLWRTLEHSFY